MECRPRLSEPVCDALDEIADEYGLSSKSQAVRKAVREMGKDV